jgi:hypothetical protein
MSLQKTHDVLICETRGLIIMGTWSYGIFDDDIACDIMANLIHCSDIVACLEGAFELAADIDYLEYDDGIAVLVSRAILDSVFNKISYLYDGFDETDDDASTQYMRWVGKISNSFSDVILKTLKPKAVVALNRVIAKDSELNELWSEDKKIYSMWKTSVEQIIRRLT